MIPSDKADLTVFYHSIEIDTVTMSISSAPDEPSGLVPRVVSRAQAVALIVDAIVGQKPERVFFNVMGKTHSMAKNTVELIKNGKLTAADLTAA